jgi:transposase
MRVYYLTMDNTPIHTPAKVCDLVESRNYKSLYLPPCSPFLNPIENFWGESQGWIRRSALSADCIYESADCQAWIRHAVSYFPRCELGVKIS